LTNNTILSILKYLRLDHLPLLADLLVNGPEFILGGVILLALAVCWVGSDQRPDDGDDAWADGGFRKELQLQLLGAEDLVNFPILLEGAIVQVLVFWLEHLEADADLSPAESAHILLRSQGIKDVPLVFQDRVMAELVAKDDAALSLFS